MALRPFRVVGKNDYRPYATFGILVVSVLFLIWEIGITVQAGQSIEQIYDSYALVTCQIGQVPITELAIDGLRSLFMHSSFVEFLTNMLFLWVFAPSVEQFLGRRRFLFFYIVAGFGGHIASIVFSGGDCLTLVGSSGSIAGVLGAFMILYPLRRIEAFVPLLGRGFNLPAFFYIIMYMGAAFFMDEGGPLSGTLAPFWDEVGGFVSGLLILFVVTLFKAAPRGNPFAHLDD